MGISLPISNIELKQRGSYIRILMSISLPISNIELKPNVSDAVLLIGISLPISNIELKHHLLPVVSANWYQFTYIQH